LLNAGALIVGRGSSEPHAVDTRIAATIENVAYLTASSRQQLNLTVPELTIRAVGVRTPACQGLPVVSRGEGASEVDVLRSSCLTPSCDSYDSTRPIPSVR